MDRAHYLRFVRTLALATLVPGCTGAAPTPSGDPHPLAEDDARTVADAATTAPDAAHDDVDAGIPFSSGPIVPPELPESFV